MPYVDGFIVAVPKKNLAAYRRMAQKAGKVWREHGALEYREWVAEDVKVGKLTSFPRSVKGGQNRGNYQKHAHDNGLLRRRRGQ
jgi:uncharacterized protein YbaA (DUF1428 family)